MIILARLFSKREGAAFFSVDINPKEEEKNSQVATNPKDLGTFPKALISVEVVHYHTVCIVPAGHNF